jgi:hypothetical protein
VGTLLIEDYAEVGKSIGVLAEVGQRVFRKHNDETSTTH